MPRPSRPRRTSGTGISICGSSTSRSLPPCLQPADHARRAEGRFRQGDQPRSDRAAACPVADRDRTRSLRRGAPYTYVTTEQFLIAFDLESLQDLPDREQLEDAGMAERVRGP